MIKIHLVTGGAPHVYEDYELNFSFTDSGQTMCDIQVPGINGVMTRYGYEAFIGRVESDDPYEQDMLKRCGYA